MPHTYPAEGNSKCHQTLSSPQVLAQVMNKGAGHAYKVLLTKDIKASDLEVQVSFLAISGRGDMGGGVIWRATDDRNYYLTRANPLEQNIRLYHVVKSVRKIIANVDQTIDVRRWHRLRVKTEGCRNEAPRSLLRGASFTTCIVVDLDFEAGNHGLPGRVAWVEEKFVRGAWLERIAQIERRAREAQEDTAVVIRYIKNSKLRAQREITE